MAESFKIAPYGVTAWIWTASFIVLTIYVGAMSGSALANGRVPDTFDGGMTVALVPLLVYAWIGRCAGTGWRGATL